MNLDEWKAKHLQDNEDDVIPCVTIPRFFEILVGDTYVIRINQQHIIKTDIGTMGSRMSIEEWNEHVKNVRSA